MAKFVYKILDKYDDHSSINFTGKNQRHFGNFRGLNRAEHERKADFLNSIMEYSGENCFTPSGKCCFLKCNIYIFKKGFTTDYFGVMKSYKRRTNNMTRCRIPELCECYKIDFGLYDVKSNRILSSTVNEKNKCLNVHEKSLLPSVEEE